MENYNAQKYTGQAKSQENYGFIRTSIHENFTANCPGIYIQQGLCSKHCFPFESYSIMAEISIFIQCA